MHPQFAELTPRWFKRAFVYTGSIGDFRYRFDMGKERAYCARRYIPCTATRRRRTGRREISHGTRPVWKS